MFSFLFVYIEYAFPSLLQTPFYFYEGLKSWICFLNNSQEENYVFLYYFYIIALIYN